MDWNEGENGAPILRRAIEGRFKEPAQTCS